MGDEHTWKKVMDIIRRYDHPFVVVSATARTTRKLVEATELARHQLPEAKAVVKKISERHRLLTEQFIATYGNQYHSKTSKKCTQWIKKCEDKLLKLLDQISKLQVLPLHLSDAVTATGEQLSSYLFAQCACSYGIQSRWVDAASIIKTDSSYGGAKPDEKAIQAQCHNLFSSASPNPILIIGGFYGSDPKGNTTTLGFEGSDLTASLIGSALSAKSIEIWTDVSGIYTCDPRVVPDAHPIDELSYSEATELAYFGAKVLHPSTMKPASRKNIPLFVKNIFDPDKPGTKIHHRARKNGSVKALTFLADASILTIRARSNQSGYEFLAHFFDRLHQFNIPVDVVTTTEAAVSVALRSEVLTASLLDSLQEIGSLEQLNNRAIISLIGCSISRSDQIAEMVFQSISQNDISMLSFSQPKQNLNLVIENSEVRDAIRSIHQRIFKNDVS